MEPRATILQMTRSDLGLKIGFALGTLTVLKHLVKTHVSEEQMTGIERARLNLQQIWESSEYVPDEKKGLDDAVN